MYTEAMILLTLALTTVAIITVMRWVVVWLVPRLMWKQATVEQRTKVFRRVLSVEDDRWYPIPTQVANSPPMERCRCVLDEGGTGLPPEVFHHGLKGGGAHNTEGATITHLIQSLVKEGRDILGGG